MRLAENFFTLLLAATVCSTRARGAMGRFLLIGLTATMIAVPVATEAAPQYPIKPIRLIVPFPPGGGVDIVARLMAQKLTESFGVAVIVDNRPGAAGTIGTELALKASPDGYTMILVEAGYSANVTLYKLSYDALNDVTPIVLVGETGFVVTLHPSVPVTNIKELIEYDKANPGKLNFGSGGTGSVNHLVVEYFNQMAGTKMTHVPYKGIGPALNDLLGGQIQVIFGGMPPMIPQIKLNRLRGIAVTTAKRSTVVSDLPTVGETVPGYEAMQWFAVLGPRALPKEVVTRWNAEINRIVQLPDVIGRLVGEGVEPVGGSPERLREVLERDIAKWKKVVETANIKQGS